MDSPKYPLALNICNTIVSGNMSANRWVSDVLELTVSDYLTNSGALINEIATWLEAHPDVTYIEVMRYVGE